MGWEEGAAPLFLAGQLPALAVLLRLVVLLSILDEPALAIDCGRAVLRGETFRFGLLPRPRLKLLHDAAAGLSAMIPFGVILRSRPTLLSVAHVPSLVSGPEREASDDVSGLSVR